MISADLAWPFSLGLVAAFNPCGFAMLPVYVSFFLGTSTEEETSTARNLARALKVGSALTVGFVAVFGLFGLITSSLISQSAILDYSPYVTFGLGFLLIPLGIAMLTGFEPKISTPRLDRGGDSGQIWSMFLFGVSYAVVSLGCTVGLFVTALSSAFTRDGFLDGILVFIAYGLGMGAVIWTLTIAVALARTSVATNMRKVLPWVNRISGVLLVLSGVYLIIYGWWEIQALRGNAPENSLVSFFEDMQSGIVTWINQTGATRLGVGLMLIVAVAIIAALSRSMTPSQRGVAIGGWVVVWAVAEFIWQRANLFILPILRTIIGFPGRIANWFSEPLRWAVLGEVLFLAIVAAALWLKFRPRSGSAPAAPAST